MRTGLLQNVCSLDEPFRTLGSESNMLVLLSVGALYDGAAETRFSLSYRENNEREGENPAIIAYGINSNKMSEWGAPQVFAKRYLFREFDRSILL